MCPYLRGPSLHPGPILSHIKSKSDFNQRMLYIHYYFFISIFRCQEVILFRESSLDSRYNLFWLEILMSFTSVSHIPGWIPGWVLWFLNRSSDNRSFVFCMFYEEEEPNLINLWLLGECEIIFRSLTFSQVAVWRIYCVST